MKNQAYLVCILPVIYNLLRALYLALDKSNGKHSSLITSFSKYPVTSGPFGTKKLSGPNPSYNTVLLTN